MNFNQQTNNSVNCGDFWKFPRNNNYFRSPNNPPSAVRDLRDFQIDSIFSSERAIISAPYHFPFDGMVKHRAFPEPTHYPIANPILEDLHQQVMSFHNPSTKMTDILPKALDIDMFLEDIFETENAKARESTPNSSLRSSNSDIADSCQQQAPSPVPRPPAPPLPAKPEAATKKRVTKAYSPCQKIQYVDLFRKEHEEKGRSFSQRQFARKYQLSHARFSAWCKEYDKLKSLDATQLMVSRVRMPSARFPVLESRVSEWVEEQRAAGHTDPTIKTIQTYARELAIKLGISDFVASNTWVERFRRRCDNKPGVTRPASGVPVSAAPTEAPTPPPSMVGEILQDFIRRSATHQSPLEMAGLGISVVRDRADWTDDVKAKRVYTEKDRERFVEIFRQEKKELGGQCSLRLFCKRHGVSRNRMTAWLKEGSADESD